MPFSTRHPPRARYPLASRRANRRPRLAPLVPRLLLLLLLVLHPPPPAAAALPRAARQSNNCPVVLPVPAGEPRIVGGTPAAPVTVSFMVALFDSAGYFKCSGVQIASDWILTARHCNVSSTWSAVIGTDDRYRGFKRSLTAVFPYPGQRDGDDIALLQLLEPRQQPAFPALNINSQHPKPGSFARAVGYGRSAFSDQSNSQLLRVDVPVTSEDQCWDAYSAAAVDGRFCAGYYVKGQCDSCLGDSGGPILQYSGDDPVVVGTVSAGKECALPGFPGLYARVEPFIDWMRSVGATFKTATSVDTYVLRDGNPHMVPADGKAVSPTPTAVSPPPVTPLPSTSPVLPIPSKTAQPSITVGPVGSALPRLSKSPFPSVAPPSPSTQPTSAILTPSPARSITAIPPGADGAPSPTNPGASTATSTPDAANSSPSPAASGAVAPTSVGGSAPTGDDDGDGDDAGVGGATGDGSGGGGNGNANGTTGDNTTVSPAAQPGGTPLPNSPPANSADNGQNQGAADANSSLSTPALVGVIVGVVAVVLLAVVASVCYVMSPRGNRANNMAP